MEEKRSDKEEEARRRKERGAGRSDEEIEKKIKKKNDMKWGRIVNHLGLGLGFVWIGSPSMDQLHWFLFFSDWLTPSRFSETNKLIFITLLWKMCKLWCIEYTMSSPKQSSFQRKNWLTAAMLLLLYSQRSCAVYSKHLYKRVSDP